MVAVRESKPRRRAKIFAAPWRDPAGRFSWFKTATLVCVVLPALFVVWQAQVGRLGGRPLHHAMLETGFWAIRFLLLCLAVTPARSLFNWPRVVQVRRMLGLAAAFYTIVHIILYAGDEGWGLGFVVNQMFTVFYLILGTIATLGFIALAVTSTDAAIMRLGRRWKLLHRLIFPIAILSFWHFFLTQKVDVGIALVPAGLFGWLGLWRLLKPDWRRSWWVMAGLAAICVVLTALVEAGWYALHSGFNPRLVLAANFSTARLSPAVLVAIDLLILLGVILLRRGMMRATAKR
ncbi:MAG: sulfoxide reductase heme-binding subunit YedZ [Acidiphilium sp. 21-60-14]|nr:MAG: sulfoxide reductase heme-binding subunit YedZ [Acidiphilium sp. 21-60-14]OYW12658.1 MAG: sulfoxide reductase heme-binding subunit YedZ [Acidiphilium sp. 37-67-22]